MPVRKPKDPERSPDLPHNWIERHLERIASLVWHSPVVLDNWEYRRARLTGPGAYEYLDTGWGRIRIGELWGGEDVTAFFRRKFIVPESHAGNDVYLDIFLDGGEAQLSIDGKAWQGLDWNRSIVPLGSCAQSGRELELSIEAFIINYPYDERRNDARELHRFKRALLVKRDGELDGFLQDARFVLDVYRSCYDSDDNPELESFLLHYLEASCRILGPETGTAEEVRLRVGRARGLLREKVFGAAAFARRGRMNVCAHSHLDIVYLWPIKETFRKNCRTATNMLSLMREYPAFRFSNSQPYLYEKLKEMYPEVFNEVRERIAERRWEAVGAMYVEPDANLLGPESLVRQILFGKRFLRREFGVDTRTCWLPDVFGAVYTLPQILKKCGVDYFVTVKLNIWNDLNRFPHDTFRWRGPDGSEVIAHFPPTHFGQEFNAANLERNWKDFREKEQVGENLFIYGWADGGGGPTREMVEASLRSERFPGLPEVRINAAEAFLQTLDGRKEQLAVWDDELYLEAHRGTYTTKGDLKKKNRKAEMLYRDAEIVSSIACFFGGDRMQERINEGWKLLLVNQFHDTLPGTHCPAGVPDIERDYERAFALGNEILESSLSFFLSAVDRGEGKEGWLFFNTLSWKRGGLVELPHGRQVSGISFGGGPAVPVQRHGGSQYVYTPELPSLGWTTAVPVPDSDALPDAGGGDTVTVLDGSFETPYYRIVFAEDGTIASLFDKQHCREVLSGPGNELQLFDDDPGHKFSGWDIAYHLEEYRYPVVPGSTWKLTANGPLFAVLSNLFDALGSEIEQEIWLYAADRRIDFKTRVQWRSKKKLLKAAFPLNVRTRTAVYDLPFGSIERATHRNTSWEQAKFEVCGHKWADLSEGDYGTALLNDCKYGYDAKDNVLRLSLLRAPVRPDVESDMGEHLFTYSLLPHAGGWRRALIVRRGYELNAPVLCRTLPAAARAGGGKRSPVPSSGSFLEVEGDSLIVETVKQEEEGPGIVLRSFDGHGCRGKAEFRMIGPVESADETNLLEEQPLPVILDADKRGFISGFTPFEIKTHRIRF